MLKGEPVSWEDYCESRSSERDFLGLGPVYATGFPRMGGLDSSVCGRDDLLVVPGFD